MGDDAPSPRALGLAIVMQSGEKQGPDETGNARRAWPGALPAFRPPGLACARNQSA